LIKLKIESVKGAETLRRAVHESKIKAQAEADLRAKLEAEQAKHVEATQETPAQFIATQQELAKPKLTEVAQGNMYLSIDPSPKELVQCVAVHFKIDEARAHKILMNTDFYLMQKVA